MNIKQYVWASVLALCGVVCASLPSQAGPQVSQLFSKRLTGQSAAVQVHHVAPYTCGVTSSKFARICRPSAQTSCKGAVTRGVKGFSSQFCAARHTACVSCLAMLKRCINRIGHGPRNEFSCDECTGKFSRCIGKRYPPLRN